MAAQFAKEREKLLNQEFRDEGQDLKNFKDFVNVQRLYNHSYTHQKMYILPDIEGNKYRQIIQIASTKDEIKRELLTDHAFHDQQESLDHRGGVGGGNLQKTSKSMIIYKILQDPVSKMCMTNNRKYFDDYRENNEENLKESYQTLQNIIKNQRHLKK